MAPHSSVLACRMPGTGEPGGLPSLGSRREGHDWGDSAAAAAAAAHKNQCCHWCWKSTFSHPCTLSNWQGTLEFCLSTATLFSSWKGSFLSTCFNKPSNFLPSANEFVIQKQGHVMKFHGLEALLILWAFSSIKKYEKSTVNNWVSIKINIFTWMGEQFRGECIHVYVWLSSFAVHLKLPQHCWSAVFQYKINVFFIK